MNSRLGKYKFNSLRVILDSVSRSSIIVGKYMQILWNKITNPIHCSTQVGYFNTKCKFKVENLLSDIDVRNRDVEFPCGRLAFHS